MFWWSIVGFTFWFSTKEIKYRSLKLKAEACYFSMKDPDSRYRLGYPCIIYLNQ